MDGDNAAAAAPQNRLLWAINHAKHLDGYAHKPVVTFPTYKSWIGAFMTLMITGVMIFYISLTLDRFVNGEPGQSLVVRAASFSPVPLHSVRVGLFAQSGNDFYSNFLFNPRLGSLAVSQKTKINKLTDNSLNLPIRTYPCNFTNPVSNNVTFGADTTVCLDFTPRTGPLPNLVGTYEDQVYTYIKMELFLCSNATSNGTCASPEEIQAALLGSNLNVIIEETRMNPDGKLVRTLVAPHWRLFPNVTLAADLFLHKHTLNRVLRIIGSDAASASNQTLRFDSIEEFSRPTLPSETVFSELYLRLSRQEVIETHSFASFLDVLSSWGALVSFLALTVGFLVQRYNEFWFRRQLPLDKKDDLHTFLFVDFDQYGRLLHTTTAPVLERRKSRALSLTSITRPDSKIEVGALEV